MIEKWLPVVGYEGYYEVSNMGKIKSLNRIIMRKNGHSQTIRERGIKPSIDKETGYYKVALCKNGQQISYCVHRLVALSFIPNPYNLPYINHKDENKLNNNVNNLEWCTPTHNANWGTSRKRQSQTRSTPIIMCDLKTHKPIREFLNPRVATEELGLNASSFGNIYQVLYGQRTSAYGYWWKYK